MFKLCFYVPLTHVEAVKTAVFAAGAGRLDDYEHCCWQTQGEGQFKPLLGSTPFIGQAETLSTVAEMKVEMLCHEGALPEVVQALLDSHPYEEPAYEYWVVYTASDVR